jgi:hypothetical protein
VSGSWPGLKGLPARDALSIQLSKTSNRQGLAVSPDSRLARLSRRGSWHSCLSSSLESCLYPLAPLQPLPAYRPGHPRSPGLGFMSYAASTHQVSASGVHGVLAIRDCCAESRDGGVTSTWGRAASLFASAHAPPLCHCYRPAWGCCLRLSLPALTGGPASLLDSGSGEALVIVPYIRGSG